MKKSTARKKGGFLVPQSFMEDQTISMSVWWKPWTWGKTRVIEGMTSRLKRAARERKL